VCINGVWCKRINSIWNIISKFRVIQDIKNMNTELHDLNTRLDKTEADSAVIKHQNQVFGTILSPSNLKDLNRHIAELQTEMKLVHKNLDKVHEMHNGTHPPVS